MQWRYVNFWWFESSYRFQDKFYNTSNTGSPVRAILPSSFSFRRANRGLESIAVSGDKTRAYTCQQVLSLRSFSLVCVYTFSFVCVYSGIIILLVLIMLVDVMIVDIITIITQTNIKPKKCSVDHGRRQQGRGNHNCAQLARYSMRCPRYFRPLECECK
jgi:hypothetical protein